jgi:transposase-like protein
MGLIRTEESRQDAVRVALTSGLTRMQLAKDLGVGMSKLKKWIKEKTRAALLLRGPSRPSGKRSDPRRRPAQVPCWTTAAVSHTSRVLDETRGELPTSQRCRVRCRSFG